MKTGILFDMDGTLWDSAKQVAEAWSTVSLPRLGKEVTQEDMYRVMGKPMDELALALFPGHGLSELLPLMEESCQVENDYLARHGARLYPGLEQTLPALAADYPLYIVSNCQTGYIEAFLSYYSFEKYFEDFICYGTNGRQKGENIALIMEKTGLGAAFMWGTSRRTMMRRRRAVRNLCMLHTGLAPWTPMCPASNRLTSSRRCSAG